MAFRNPYEDKHGYGFKSIGEELWHRRDWGEIGIEDLNDEGKKEFFQYAVDSGKLSYGDLKNETINSFKIKAPEYDENIYINDYYQSLKEKHGMEDKNTFKETLSKLGKGLKGLSEGNMNRTVPMEYDNKGNYDFNVPEPSAKYDELKQKLGSNDTTDEIDRPDLIDNRTVPMKYDKDGNYDFTPERQEANFGEFREKEQKEQEEVKPDYVDEMYDNRMIPMPYDSDGNIDFEALSQGKIMSESRRIPEEDRPPSIFQAMKTGLWQGTLSLSKGIVNLPVIAHRIAAETTDLITPDWIYSTEQDLLLQGMESAADWYEEQELKYIEGDEVKELNELGFLNPSRIVYTGSSAIPTILATMYAGMGLEATVRNGLSIASQLVSKAPQVARMLPFGAVAGSNSQREAENAGATFAESVVYGTLVGLAETATEGPVVESVLETLTGKNLIRNGAKTIAGKYGQLGLRVMRNIIMEAGQEAIMEPLEGLAGKSTFDPERPWIGQGGVVDPGAMLEGGYGGFAMSTMLLGLGMPGRMASNKHAQKMLEQRMKDKAILQSDYHKLEEQIKLDMEDLTDEDRMKFRDDRLQGVMRALTGNDASFTQLKTTEMLKQLQENPELLEDNKFMNKLNLNSEMLQYGLFNKNLPEATREQSRTVLNAISRVTEAVESGDPYSVDMDIKEDKTETNEEMVSKAYNLLVEQYGKPENEEEQKFIDEKAREIADFDAYHRRNVNQKLSDMNVAPQEEDSLESLGVELEEIEGALSNITQDIEERRADPARVKDQETIKELESQQQDLITRRDVINEQLSGMEQGETVQAELDENGEVTEETIAQQQEQIEEDMLGQEKQETTQQLDKEGHVTEETIAQQQEQIENTVLSQAEQKTEVQLDEKGEIPQDTIEQQQKDIEDQIVPKEEAPEGRIKYTDEKPQDTTGQKKKEEPGTNTNDTQNEAETGKKSGIAKDNDGNSIEFVYEVIDANNLITSHDTGLAVNKNYPSELQPRDRGKAGYELQINDIVNNLQPEFLGENPKISEGSPIIGTDNVVESGNGRVMALTKIYQNNHANKEKYIEWLKNNAEKFGIDKDNLPENPILVRRRTSEVDRVEFVKKANESSVVSMSATEIAKTDSERLNSNILELFVANENGTINTPENKGFIAKFIGEVVPKNEQNKYLTKDGQLTQDGLLRVRNAIFYKAYNHPQLMNKLAESLDTSAKNVINTLLSIAPQIVDLQERMEKGNLHKVDFSKDIAEAANIFINLKEANQDIEIYLKQKSFFDNENTKLIKDIVKIFNDNRRSTKGMVEVFNKLVDTIERLGDPKQVNLFGDSQSYNKSELLETTLRRLENENKQTTIFDTQDQDSKSDDGKDTQTTETETEQESHIVRLEGRPKELKGISPNLVKKDPGYAYTTVEFYINGDDLYVALKGNGTKWGKIEGYKNYTALQITAPTELGRHFEDGILQLWKQEGLPFGYTKPILREPSKPKKDTKQEPTKGETTESEITPKVITIDNEDRKTFTVKVGDLVSIRFKDNDFRIKEVLTSYKDKLKAKDPNNSNDEGTYYSFSMVYPMETKKQEDIINAEKKEIENEVRDRDKAMVKRLYDQAMEGAKKAGINLKLDLKFVEKIQRDITDSILKEHNLDENSEAYIAGLNEISKQDNTIESSILIALDKDSLMKQEIVHEYAELWVTMWANSIQDDTSTFTKAEYDKALNYFMDKGNISEAEAREMLVEIFTDRLLEKNIEEETGGFENVGSILDKAYNRFAKWLKSVIERINYYKKQVWGQLPESVQKQADLFADGKWEEAFSMVKDRSIDTKERLSVKDSAFKKWFGESKVVDKKGNPLVVYHGSPKAFTVFNASNAPGWGKGMYFTDNKENAEEYIYGDGKTGNVQEVYLKIENPFYGDPLSYEELENTKAYKELDTKEDAVDLYNEDGNFANKVIRELGYDGIIAEESNNIDGLEIVVFDPTQIKSIYNEGTWDRDNPDIRYSIKNKTDIGYHAGDLGKAEHLGNQRGSNRGTGHFGTGTYFVGNRDNIDLGTYKDRPMHEVDFSNYNLFKPSTNEQALDLHDALKYINTWHEVATKDIVNEKDMETMQYDELDVSKDLFIKHVEYFEEDFLLNVGISLDDYIAKREENSKANMFLKRRKENLEHDNKMIESSKERQEEALKELNARFNKSESEILKLINEVYKEINDEKDNWKTDSASTRFMKKLGYEGVDVRHLDMLDNTRYGSVIYDLKSEADFKDTKYSIKESDYAPTFYSKLEQVINEKMPNASNPGQIMNIIKKGGVKKDEINWSGIEEYLQTKNKFTKEEVIDYIKANEVSIVEVSKGAMERKPLTLDFLDKYNLKETNVRNRAGNGIFDVTYQNADYEVLLEVRDNQILDILDSELFNYDFKEQHDEVVDIINDYARNVREDSTKFSNYTLPGGENYSELLLTMPNLKDSFYYKAHWDEERNVVAHVRFNTRLSSTGEKVLFLEEVQSDWHQKGRQDGYAGDSILTKEQQELLDSYSEELQQLRIKQLEMVYLFDRSDENKAREEKDNDTKRLKEIEAILKEAGITEVLEKKRREVSNAPFKNNWYELVVKRMIRYAAENGYDRIAWTTGEQQNERYNLSKVISEISYEKIYIESSDSYEYFIKASDKNDTLVFFKEYDNLKDAEADLGVDAVKEIETKTKDWVNTPQEKWDEIELKRNEIIEEFGVDSAEYEQILDEIEQLNDMDNSMIYGKSDIIEDLSFEHGGEGMKGFYNKILPKTIEKYVKKWKSKVEVSKIKQDSYYDSVKWWTYEVSSRNDSLVGTEAENNLGEIVTVKQGDIVLLDEYKNEPDNESTLLVFDTKEEAEKAGKELYEIDKDIIEQLSIPITEQMKKAALYEGQPLFSLKGKGDPILDRYKKVFGANEQEKNTTKPITKKPKGKLPKKTAREVAIERLALEHVVSMEKAGYEFVYGEMSEDFRKTLSGMMGVFRTNTLKTSGIAVRKMTPSKHVAYFVKNALQSGEKITYKQLQEWSDKAFGGKQTEGKYNAKDAYDAMELGMNQYILENNLLPVENLTPEDVKHSIRLLAEALNLLPTQGTHNRTEEMLEYQQFSTPPTIAYISHWLANVNKNDTVLEPSAGIGGLVVFSEKLGADVVVNEYSKRRLGILKELFNKTYNENAEQIDNILPDKIKPTVVIMNPPFSATAGRVEGQRKTQNATRHIEQALARLEPGGRLVAIVGNGMADDASAFKKWWDKMKSQYQVKANVTIDGYNYRKYGTTFDINMFVIDKVAPDGTETITGKVKDLEEIIDLLGGVVNERQENVKVQRGRKDQQTTPKHTGKEGTGETEGRSDGGNDLSSTTGGMGTGTEENNNKGSRKDTRDGEGDISRTDKPHDVSERSDQSDGLLEGDNQAKGTSEQGTNRDSDVSPRSDTLGDAGNRIDTRNKIKDESKAENKNKKLGDQIFEEYIPMKLSIKDAKQHPTTLSESSAMGAVEPPEVTYKPSLPYNVINDGVLSIAQLEAVVYAGQSHEQNIPSGERRGYFIGDGTGVGKGREIAGIILDNMQKGRTKNIWITKNKDLFTDARRDLGALGVDTSKIFDLGKTKLGDPVEVSDGVMVSTYGTMISSKGEQDYMSRVDQIVKWVGKDFDGVIAFDESHMMANAIDHGEGFNKKTASQTANAGIELQRKLPNARIVYVSATGATEVHNLAYAERLGLWGEGTDFANQLDFINKITSGGLAAMELIARDMKASGLYLARSLSYEGVSYDRLEHNLTPEQEEIYDTISNGWQIVLRNMDEAMNITGMSGNRKAVSQAKKNFWGTQQRFYGMLLTSLQMPSVIKDIKTQLKDGNAVVLQLIDTNEALLTDKLSKMDKDDKLEDLEITPKEKLLDYVRNYFPVWQYEEYEEDGKKKSRIVKDSEGNFVESKEAVRMRDRLIEDIAIIKMPDGALDILLNEFGPEAIAEITGRSRRIINKLNGRTGKMETTLEKRTQRHIDADVKSFSDDKKKILVFSKKGGTGKSYHADLGIKNQRKRIHYLIQAGWRADDAIQGFGRTHRSNQKQPPLYKLVTTDLQGQRRFISTIAKRLDQLGALTKGQRQTGSQGMFKATDNLESPIAKDALKRFYTDLSDGRMSYLGDYKEIFEALGLNKLLDEDTGRVVPSDDRLRNVTQFLNRILVLPKNMQNELFDEFMDRIETLAKVAEENGTLDIGLENFQADKVEIKDEKVVREDSQTGAETKYIGLDAYYKNKPIDFDDIEKVYGINPESTEFKGYYYNTRSKAIYTIIKGRQKTMNDGSIQQIYKAFGQLNDGYNSITQEQLEKGNYKKVELKEARELWTKAVNKIPEYNKKSIHMITGVLLPVWSRLPQGKARVMRVLTNDGQMLLGRLIPESEIDYTLMRLGAERNKEKLTNEEVASKILSDGFTAHLANGWKLQRKRVAYENRIEILGDDIHKFRNELRDKGVFIEIKNGKGRFFIPSGDKMLDILGEVIKYRPVIEVVAPSKGKEGQDIGSFVKSFKVAPSVPSVGSNTQVVNKNKKNKKVKTIPNIIKGLEEDFKIGISSKRYNKNRKALGIYNTHEESISTRVADDLEVIAHELGHHLDKTYGFSKLKDKAIREMVVNLPLSFAQNYKPSELPEEAIAEFVRRYLANPQIAQEFGPSFYEIFEEKLSKKHKKIIQQAQKDISEWYSQSLVDRTKSTSISKTEKRREPLNMLSKKAYMMLFDDMAPVKDFSKFIEESTGDKLPVHLDPYKMALNVRGADMIALHTVDGYMTDPEGNRIGKSFSAIFEKNINSKNWDDFNNYLKAKHSLSWFKKGRQVFNEAINEETDIPQLVEYYEQNYPEFVETANELYEWWQTFVENWLVNTGLVEEGLWEELKEMYPHYVPLYREADTQDISKGVGSGFVNKNNPMKRASREGSARPTGVPIESMIMDISRIVKTVKKREVMLIIHNHAQNVSGLSYFIKKVPTKMLPSNVFAGDVKSKMIEEMVREELNTLSKEERIFFNALNWKQKIEYIKKQGWNNQVDIIDNLMDDVLTQWKPEQFSRDTEIVSVIDENGNKHWYEVKDPLFLKALHQLSPKGLHPVIQLVGQITRLRKVLITGLNPFFGVVSNMPRDLMQAAILGSYKNPIRYFKEWIKAFKEVVSKDDIYQTYHAIGGGHASMFSSQRKMTKEMLGNTIPGYRKKHFMSSLIASVERFNDAIESMPRLAELKNYDLSTYEGRMQALYESNDVTLNFKKRGTLSYGIDPFIMFFNAGMQEIDKLSRAAVKDKKQYATRLAKGLTLITIPTIMLAIMMDDDDDYEMLSSFMKDNYWILPKEWFGGEDGEFYRIPIPRALGILFGSGFERAFNDVFKDDPKAWKGFTEAIYQNVLPPVQTVFAPITEAKHNQSWSGTPIVSRSEENLPSGYQYDENTSEISKGIAKIMDMIPENIPIISEVMGDDTLRSPKKIEYLIKQYSGLVGQMVLPATTKKNIAPIKEGIKEGDISKIGEGLNMTVEGFARRTQADPAYSSDYMNDFYNYSDDLSKWEQELKQFGTYDERYVPGYKQAYSKMGSYFSDIRKNIEAIENSNLPKPEKKRMVKELRLSMNQIANELNLQYEDYLNSLK